MSSLLCKIYALESIYGMYFLLQLVISHITHSLTLLTDSYHTLYNIMSLASYIFMLKMSTEQKLKNTFGWARIELLSKLISITALAGLCYSTTVEAIQTIIHASHSDAMHFPLQVMVIGIAGVLINFICVVCIGGISLPQSVINVSQTVVHVSVTVVQDTEQITETSMQKQSSSTGDNNRIHVLRYIQETIYSTLVIICSIVVYMTNEEGRIALYIDPLLCILAAIILLSTSYSLMKESILILLQTVPTNMDVATIRQKLMKEFPMIQNVHDLHIWRLTKDNVIATIHIMFTSLKEYRDIRDDVCQFFVKEGISLTTIQPEIIQVTGENTQANMKCTLRCPNDNCQSLKCCTENVEHGKTENII